MSFLKLVATELNQSKKENLFRHLLFGPFYLFYGYRMILNELNDTLIVSIYMLNDLFKMQF